MKIHFVTTDLPLVPSECREYGKELEAALAKLGRPQDKVIVMAQLKYNGSIDVEEPF